jgi:hypothetical protein
MKKTGSIFSLLKPDEKITEVYKDNPVFTARIKTLTEKIEAEVADVYKNSGKYFITPKGIVGQSPMLGMIDRDSLEVYVYCDYLEIWLDNYKIE